MLHYPDIDPVAFTLGPLAVHWYGLAYLAGIGGGWWLLHRRAAAGSVPGWNTAEVGDVVFYAALGAVLGGRIGYGLFYNLPQYAAAPGEIFAVWRGGMSFHGGMLGFMVALFLYARRKQRRFLAVTDLLVPVVPIGLFFGRLANFVNQELWGAPTSLPWGVLFTHPAAGGVPRHPSQIYEALLEGVLLYGVLEWSRRRRSPLGVLSALFLVGYGCIRFAIEFVREPDAQLGYLAAGWVTMGQILSLPMIVIGLAMLVAARQAGRTPSVDRR